MITKKTPVIFFIISLFILCKINAHEMIQQDDICVDTEQRIESTTITSKWHKRGMFLLGCLNGFYLPLTYAVALGLNVVDLSDPVLKENLQPFAQGATLGIGCWFAYKIVEWYVQIAVLKTLNAALQNPVINKVVSENIRESTNAG